MKEILFKDEVIKHLLEGIDHLATDGMAERRAEVMELSRNINNLSLKELSLLLRNTRKCISIEWRGFEKWHEQCCINDSLLNRAIVGSIEVK